MIFWPQPRPEAAKAEISLRVARMIAVLFEIWPDSQQRDREKRFRDYRLRVAAVIRDYGMNERAEAPADNRVVHGWR
jgi:hypothetical protein